MISFKCSDLNELQDITDKLRQIRRRKPVLMVISQSLDAVVIPEPELAIPKPTYTDALIRLVTDEVRETPEERNARIRRTLERLRKEYPVRRERPEGSRLLCVPG